jgi:hypothetical protein
MTTDNCCFYLQNRLIQTSQTGGQQYSDTFFPFSIPCWGHVLGGNEGGSLVKGEKRFFVCERTTKLELHFSLFYVSLHLYNSPRTPVR